MGLPLTPTERATLKFLQSLLLTGLLSAMYALSQAMATNGNVNWQQLALIAFTAFAFSIAHATAKYFTAKGDVQTGVVVETMTGVVQNKVQEAVAKSSPMTASALQKSMTYTAPTTPDFLAVQQEAFAKQMTTPMQPVQIAKQQ